MGGGRSFLDGTANPRGEAAPEKYNRNCTTCSNFDKELNTSIALTLIGKLFGAFNFDCFENLMAKKNLS